MAEGLFGFDGAKSGRKRRRTQDGLRQSGDGPRGTEWEGGRQGAGVGASGGEGRSRDNARARGDKVFVWEHVKEKVGS